MRLKVAILKEILFPLLKSKQTFNQPKLLLEYNNVNSSLLPKQKLKSAKLSLPCVILNQV